MSIEKRGIPQSLRILVAGIHDKGRGAAGMPSAYLPIVGPFRSHAFMQLDDFETVRVRVGVVRAPACLPAAACVRARFF